MTRILSLGVALMLTLTLNTLAAEPPKYEPVPAKLFQTRGGLGNVLAKLQAGKEVRIAYFGGSITAANGWRPKTTKWFQDTFPGAKAVEINAAIGGTGSDLGVYRYEQDVLRHKPDLVFVEFSVNDGGADPLNIWRAMEGIVRKTWQADPSTDLCFVYTFRVGYEKDLLKGMCPQAAGADEILAEYYGIPSINMALRTVQLAEEGKLIYVPPKEAAGTVQPTPEGVMLFSTDGVHPLDAPHQMYTDVIADALRQMQPAPKPGAHELKAPMVADNWETAKMVFLEPWMLSPGWTRLDPTKGMGASFAKYMPQMWEALRPGDKIQFRFRGTGAKLYDILGPDGGQAVVTVDGKASDP
ncbi:SGNH/GDSL hydrolase family protein, partial [bacterium]|nr:SGNH/GDSL hydrolase family protein [bacterium]